MKIRPSDPHNLHDFKLLSFDVYGTLVDWESGIYDELQPLLERLASDHYLKHDRNETIKAFNTEEVALCHSRPGMKYDALLTEAYYNFASSLSLPRPSQSEAERLGGSVGRWPAFPDTVEALNRLANHYKLVILSNVDNASISHTLAGPLKNVKFNAVYTAEDIGTYKPDLNNFHYLLKHVKEDFGVGKEEILHTGHGLKADHVAAKQMGIVSAWIARGDGKGGPGSELEEVQGKVAFPWQFDTMGEMADAVDENFASK